MNPALKRAALCCALLATSCLSAPALAQNYTSVAPSVRETVDENGVDLATGSISMPKAVLSIGSGQSKISYEATIEAGRSYVNLYGWIVRNSSTSYTVSVGTMSETFTLANGVFTPVEARGSTLTTASNGFVYTTADGTVATFDNAGDPNFGRLSTDPNSGTPMIVKLQRANGEQLDYVHYTQTLQTGQMVGCCTPVLATGRRITAVHSNFGYQIRFDYQSDSVSSISTSEPWRTVVKVRAINNAVEACVSSPSPCSTAQSWPKLDLGWNGTTRVQTYTDTAGQVTSFTYNGAQGQVSAVRLPGSTTDDMIIAYDGSNRVSSVTNRGLTTGYAYADLNGVRTTTVSYPGGATRVLTFNIAAGTLLTDRDELNRVTAYQYDASNRVTRITRPEGNYTQLTYDGRGNAIQVLARDKSGNSANDIVTSAAYPTSCTNARTCNRPSSTTDALGRTTDYTYDPNHGGILTVTLPAPTANAPRPQTRTTYAAQQASYYNGNGSIVSGPAITQQTATSTCQTTSSCAGTADEVKSTVTYSSAANLLPVAASTGSGDGLLVATRAVSYDNVRNIVAVDGPLSGNGDTQMARYDALRRRVGTVSPDPDGAGAGKHRAQRFTFNSQGRLTKIEAGTVNSLSDADWAAMTVLRTTDIGYDATGRRAWQKVSAGGTVQAAAQFSYDARGRAECHAVRMNPAAFASLPISACSQGAAGSFGPDRITKTVYDAASQVTQVVTAVGTPLEAAETASVYTLNGKVASVADGENNRTTFEYDGHDRLSKTRYPVSTKGAGTSSTTDFEQLGYDANGNVTSWRLRDGSSIALGYDALNRVTLKNLPGSEPDVSYAYDLLGRMIAANQSGNNLTFAYDALGRMHSQSGPHGSLTSLFDSAGRRTRLTHPDGFYVNHDFLVTGEVSAIRENGATSGAGVLATYAYDDLGRRTSLVRGDGSTQSYGFDGISRLTSMNDDLPGASHDMLLGFSYNPAGQVTQATRSNDIYRWNGHYNVNRNYAANGLNQYTASGSVTPSYDLRGNLTAAGGPVYGYSAENMLTSASNGVTLAYDPMLRLYQIGGGSAGTTRMAYDGPSLVAEYNGSNALLRRYVHGPGADEALVWYEGSGTADRRFLHADERGSVVAVTNSSGSVLSVNSYDEYGIPGTANLGRFQYTGQTWLPELGMYNYKARIYSPSLGRFLQTDPIGFADGVNLYNYVGSDPIGRRDPTGMFEVCYEIYIPAAPYSSPTQSTSNSGIVVNGGRFEQKCVQIPDSFGPPSGPGPLPGYDPGPQGPTGPLAPTPASLGTPPAQQRRGCPNSTNVALSGSFYVPPVGPAYFSGELRDVTTGRTMSVSGFGWSIGLQIGRYDVTGTVQGFGALRNGLDISWAEGPYGTGTARITDNDGRNIGDGSVTAGIAPDIGAGVVSFDPPTLKQSNPGQCPR